MMNRIPINQEIPLPAIGTWPPATHIFDAETAYALETALAARRPLLVRGDPGTGKSQLARAAAQVLGRLFVAEVVHARSESQELQFQFDAVSRLGEAQALGGASEAERTRLLAPTRFLSPGPLWWVFNWQSAQRQLQACLHQPCLPEPPPDWDESKGSVLLIDEIDKADADLPNGLLETLGNGAFSVPWVRQVVGLSTAAQQNPPLVVITTNEERELPHAFLRRCMVSHVRMPNLELLKRRAKSQPDIDCSEKVLNRVADRLEQDREDAAEHNAQRPGQAEYLDILRALTQMTRELPTPEAQAEEQMRLVEVICGYAFRKWGGSGVE